MLRCHIGHSLEGLACAVSMSSPSKLPWLLLLLLMLPSSSSLLRTDTCKLGLLVTDRGAMSMALRGPRVVCSNTRHTMHVQARWNVFDVNTVYQRQTNTYNGHYTVSSGACCSPSQHTIGGHCRLASTHVASTGACWAYHGVVCGWRSGCQLVPGRMLRCQSSPSLAGAANDCALDGAGGF